MEYMIECIKCGQIKALNVAGVCYDCYSTGKGKDVVEMLDMVRDLMKNKDTTAVEPTDDQRVSEMTQRLIEGRPDELKQVLKVHCFYGSLIDIQNQMNKFFISEGVGKDRLVDIKYNNGGWNDNNTVMIFYV